MSQTLLVAATSSSVPKDGGGMIGSTPERVPDSTYYRRRIRSKELHLVVEEAQAPTVPERSSRPPSSTSSSKPHTPSTSNPTSSTSEADA